MDLESISSPAAAGPLHEPEWIDENLMRIDGVEFYVTTDQEALHAHPSTRNHFLLGKNRQMIDDILALRDRELRRAATRGAASSLPSNTRPSPFPH